MLPYGRCLDSYNNNNAITHSTRSHTNPVSHSPSGLPSMMKHGLPQNPFGFHQNIHPVFVSHGISFTPTPSYIAPQYIPHTYLPAFDYHASPLTSLQSTSNNFFHNQDACIGNKCNHIDYRDPPDGHISQCPSPLPLYFGNSCIYPNCGVYSYGHYPSMMRSCSLRTMCCYNSVFSDSLTDSDLSGRYLSPLSPLSPGQFSPAYNERCLATPPRTLKRTNSQMDLSPSLSMSTPHSYKSTPRKSNVKGFMSGQKIIKTSNFDNKFSRGNEKCNHSRSDFSHYYKGTPNKNIAQSSSPVFYDPISPNSSNDVRRSGDISVNSKHCSHMHSKSSSSFNDIRHSRINKPAALVLARQVGSLYRVFT